MNVTKKHRILYVVTKASWGGAQRYVYDMALGARALGHEVLVVTGAPEELTTRLTRAGILVRSISLLKRDVSLLHEFQVFGELIQIMREYKPTVVHSNSSKAGGLVSFAARLSGVPQILFTAHGWAFNEDRPRWQKLFIWFLHYATVLLSHTTICVSSAMKRDARHMPFVGHKLHVIHNGVQEYPMASREDAQMILAPHISFPIWIGTIAELHPTKQVSVLIEAFARIQDAYPNATVVVMGEGSERMRLEELVRLHGLQDRVRLRGHVEDASAYLNALDIFVLPSRSEGLGYVLLEAGLAHLPVIASNVGGIPEIIEDTVTGSLFPSADVDALAGLLVQYLDDAHLRARMGDALHKRVISDFSLEKMVSKTLALY